MGARKPVLPVIVVCCVLAGWFAWVCMPAFAAAPEAPGPVTVEHMGATKITVNGVLNPNAEGQAGTYEFLYKESKSGPGCEGAGRAPESPGIVFGFQGQGVSQELTGLSPDTEYRVCLLDRNINQARGEEAVSPAATFKTNAMLEVPETGVSATDITATSAKLQGVLNPGAPGDPGSYEFVYRASATECQGEGASSGGALGGVKETVSAEVSKLAPNTQYTFCLLARNEAGETAVGSPETFTTESRKPSVSGTSSSNAGSKGVRIAARVETGGLETTFTVQYGVSIAYGSETSVKVSAGGSGTVTAELLELEPKTEYHFRVAVVNGDGSETSVGGVFRTLPASFPGLPDGRVYEMVTPVNNREAEVYVPEATNNDGENEGNGVEQPFQAASDGEAVAYVAAPSTGGNGQISLGGGNEYVAARLPGGGWSQVNVSTPNYTKSSGTYYMGFSADLSQGVLSFPLDPEEELNAVPLAPGVPAGGYRVLYARDTASGEDRYQPLFTVTPPNRSPIEFGSNRTETDALGYHKDAGSPVFAGGSADFGHLLFEANDALIGGEGSLERELNQDAKSEVREGKNNEYLYGSTDGSLSLVDVLPEGKVAQNATFGAEALREPHGNLADFSHVISENGDRIFWTDRNTGIIYVREDDTHTVQISAGSARFWTATPDGQYVFYTEDGALWRFDVESEKAEQLAGTGAEVQGVIGASNDGSYVYFAADGALAPGATPQDCEPEPPVLGENSTGGCNLYVIHEGVTRFIRILSSEDGIRVNPMAEIRGNTDEFGDWQPGLGDRTAEVTPDGRSLVFMSNESLTGSPNNILYEVYVYNFESNQVFCASCTQSGESPDGNTRGAAAFLPISWSGTYIPQWISEDGDRVFFDSAQSLVPRDTSGKQNVYEWEREGAGSCVVGSGVNGGCIYLLSNGVDGSASWLAGESADGDDVFIVTRAQLVPRDDNENYDLYDVRVDGAPPIPPAECFGTGCQGVPSPSPTFATPSSVTFDGVGNFVPVTSVETAVKAKTKPLTRAQKLTRALKVCRGKPKKRRSSCDAQARKQYGRARKAAKKSKSTRGSR